MAYLRARKGKTWQRKVQMFEEHADESLVTIRQSLLDRRFVTSPYRVKRIYEPKERDIFILPFAPDRIVQHALMNVLEPIWNKLLIDATYACRAGKGPHAGSRRVMGFVRSYKYCLQCDVSKFYPSIDHNVLYEIIQHKIKCSGTLWLLRQIIYSTPGGKNTPIGNYTSQWFGNIYLNELDQELKHRCKVRAYARYCDDFVLFDDDKARLIGLAAVIKEFVASRLKMTLSKCRLFPVSQGVDFLGYRHFPDYILLRKSTAKRVRRRMARLPRLLETGRITPEQFRSSVASTAGWLKWANTHNLVISLRLDELRGMCSAPA